MSTHGLNSGIDNTFGLKSGSAGKIHDRLRSHSVMHHLLNPKQIDAIGNPSGADPTTDPNSPESQAARDEEVRKKLLAAQTGGYAATILAGKTDGSTNTAASMLYGS